MPVPIKLVRRVLNKIRALEANARVAKVLFHDLDEDVAAGLDLVNVPYTGMPTLKASIDNLISEADAMHKTLFDLAQQNNVDVPLDDDEGVIIPMSGGGGKP